LLELPAAQGQRLGVLRFKMNRHLRLRCLICAIIVVLLPLIASALKQDKPVVYKSLKSDLDGDGFEDTIVFICYDPMYYFEYSSFGYDRYVLEINGVFVISRCMNLDAEIQIIDIDTSDVYREIAIPESGPSGDRSTYIYRYHRSKGGLMGEIKFIGQFPGQVDDLNGILKVDGDGILRTECRGQVLHTWWYPCRFRVYLSGDVEFEDEELHPMNTPVALKSELRLWKSRDDSTIVTILHPGEKAVILASDDEKWCLIEAQGGARGWFALKERIYIQATGEYVGEVFDGLHFAN
jgi:hypothetical protein